MSKDTPFQISREKHLDHIVKVIPFIALMFGVQGYILTKIHEGLGGSAIFVLAACLIIMITAFITYDVKHQVTFYEDHLVMKFLGLQKTLKYTEIQQVFISEANQSFASIQLRTSSGRFTFFFVDDADGIKTFLDSKKTPTEFKAAA